MDRFPTRLLLVAFLSLLPSQSACGKPPAAPGRQLRLDRFGDPLPRGAVARLGTVRLRHRSEIWSVIFSRDGRRFYANELLSAPKFGPIPTGGVHVWDTATGKLIRFVSGQPFGSGRLALSRDGKLLAAESGASSVWIWDLEKGATVCRIDWNDWCKNKDGNLISAVFSPDGKTLATIGAGSPIHLWEVRTGKPLRRFSNQEGGLDLLYCRGGKALACSGEGSLQLWDVKTAKELWRFPGPKRGFHSLALSPDEKVLAAGGADGSIYLVDPDSGKLLRRWRAHGPGGGSRSNFREVHSLAFSPKENILASGGEDDVIRLWDAATGKQLRQLPGHDGIVYSVAFSPDGKTLASGGIDRWVRLWDTASGKELLPFGGHRHIVSSIAFAPDGKALASVGFYGEVLLWDLATVRERIVSGDKLPTDTIAISPNGKLVAWAGRDNSIRLHDRESAKEVRRLNGHQDEILLLAFAANGKTLVSSSRDGTIRCWDVASGKEVRRIAPKGTEVGWPVVFSHDRRLLARAKGETISVCDVATGKLLRRHSLGYEASGLALSPDGKYVAATNLGGAEIRFWDLEVRKVIHTFSGHERYVGPMAFTPDGRMLLSGANDNTVRLWEVASGEEAFCFRGHRDWIVSLAVAPSGRVAASGSADATILLWDLAGLLHDKGAQGPVGADELPALWADLAGRAPVAHRAVWRLTSAADRAVSFLQGKLAAVPPVTPERIARLVADLDNHRFRTREQAADELERIGDAAIPALRKVLEGRPPLELHQRVARLLEQLQATVPSARRLRECRAVAILEYAGTPRTRTLLRSLAGGAPKARLTREAKAALARLNTAHTTPAKPESRSNKHRSPP